MPIPHHRVPADLSSVHEPVYLGLDVPRASGLALVIFLTLWSFTWHSSSSRTLFLIPIWGAFITLGFWEVGGFPLWQVLRWGAQWVLRKRPNKAAPRHPHPLFRA